MRGALICLWALAVGPAAASADEAPGDEPGGKAAAIALVDEGNQAFAGGDFQTALDRYQAAYEAYQSQKIAFNMARCHDRLGHAVEAAELFAGFLREPPVEAGSPMYAEAEDSLARLDGQLAKLSLSVEPAPEGLVTRLDARPFPADGAERRVRPGTRRVWAEAPGYAQTSRAVELKAGGAEVLRLTLLPLEAPPADDAGGGLPWWVWVAAGAAVCVAGVSVAAAASGPGAFDPAPGELPSTRIGEWSAR